MVLRPKAWESRSPPGHRRAPPIVPWCRRSVATRSPFMGAVQVLQCQPYRAEPLFTIAEPSHGAGWSSPVARQAHNLKVAGSNPAPATKEAPENIDVFGGFSIPESGLISRDQHIVNTDAGARNFDRPIKSRRKRGAVVADRRSAAGRRHPIQYRRRHLSGPRGLVGHRDSVAGVSREMHAPGLAGSPGRSSAGRGRAGASVRRRPPDVFVLDRRGVADRNTGSRSARAAPR